MFNRRNRSLAEQRRFSVSEWNGAPVEEVTGSAHPPSPMDGSTEGSSERSSVNKSNRSIYSDIVAVGNNETPATPEINLGSVYNAIEGGRHGNSAMAVVDGVSPRGRNDDAPVAAEMDDSTASRHGIDDSLSSSRKSDDCQFQRKSSTRSRRRATDATVAPSSSASRTSYSSSAGTNIWTKLLGRSDSLWDGIDGKDVYDDTDMMFEDDDDGLDSLANGMEGFKEEVKDCKTNMWRMGLSWWYEVRHIMVTVWKHPRIWLVSLAAFGLLFGVGMVAISAQKERHVNKQQMTAEFIARETGEWFANEFRKAMLPLYSVQQGVTHSNYFDDAATKIGRFPNRVVPETADAMKVFRNVTGICDDPDLQLKFRQIVQPVNRENDLDGVVFGYRLALSNVFCLYERSNMETPDKHFGFDVGSSPQIKFWSGVTEDMFVNKKYSIYGPFGMPDKKEEIFCGHIPVFKAGTQGLNVNGEEVPEAWGFVMIYLDWELLKDRSNIYERFAGCSMDFQLTTPIRGEDAYQRFASFPEENVLAESPNADLLDDTNSVVITTNSLHGEWSHRVGDIAGWGPPWYSSAVAAVFLCSLLLAFLTALTLVERQLHRNLVHKMLPSNAIAKLQRGQTVLEKYKLVTIFFSDIVGFTSMAGSMRPIQVMKMLNELYTELDMLVEKHKVYKVETIGDAYMVVGGAPDRVPAPLAAERVALFALDAVNFVKNFRTKDGDRVFIRAGLASGPVVAGVVGQAMPRYCFFGDTVNFASRMESTSKKMKVQMAEITYRLLRDSPNMNFRMTKRMDGDIAGVVIKGKGHQITYWADSAAERVSANDDKVIGISKVVDTLPMLDVSLKSDMETPRDWVSGLPKLSETSEPNSDAGSSGNYEEFLKIMNTPSAQQEMSMYTSGEISAAMSAQDWEKLGHAESALVAATNDNKKMIVRASAILEHHLDRLLKYRDADAKMSDVVKLQIIGFVGEVAETYTDTAKFHNLAHAMHVTTSMNKLLTSAVLEDPLNSFSLVFSALIHDAGHTGMNNKILSEIHHPLSKKYNKDVPTAEKNSIDIGLDIFFGEEFEELRMAILPGVLDKIKFTKTMFQAILVTDIASPDRVKLGLERFAVAQGEQGEYEDRLCPLASHLEDLCIRTGLDKEAKEEFHDEFVITHEGLQMCVRNEHLMLISDISHLVQHWENFAKWNFRLFKEIKECSRQGLCDDPVEGWFQGQIGFINHYILPLAKRSKTFLKKECGDALVENGESNLKLWKQHGAEATSIMVAAVANSEDETDVLLRLYELPTRTLAAPQCSLGST